MPGGGIAAEAGKRGAEPSARAALSGSGGPTGTTVSRPLAETGSAADGSMGAPAPTPGTVTLGPDFTARLESGGGSAFPCRSKRLRRSGLAGAPEWAARFRLPGVFWLDSACSETSRAGGPAGTPVGRRCGGRRSISVTRSCAWARSASTAACMRLRRSSGSARGPPAGVAAGRAPASLAPRSRCGSGRLWPSSVIRSPLRPAQRDDAGRTVQRSIQRTLYSSLMINRDPGTQISR